MSTSLLPQWWQICVSYFLCLLMINICLVFLYIKEKYIYGFYIIVGETPPRLSSHSLGVSWLCCGHWFHSTSSLSCIALASTRLWVSFLWWIMSDREFFYLVFTMFFSFMWLTFVFVLFRGDEDGWWLCSAYVIWFENLESDFFWIEDLDSLILALL